jgi:hypothetical protein
MAGKQLFARVVVTALVLGNLGAYYFLWPGRSPQPTSSEASVGRTSLKREDTVAVAEEQERVPAPKPPLEAPLPVAPVEFTSVKKSEEQPRNPGETTIAVQLPDPGSLGPVPPEAPQKVVPLQPGLATDDQQRKLESLKQALSEKPASHELAPVPPKQPGPAPQALNLANSPWSITQLEITQGRTLLRIRLHKSAEFKVLCDRVEMKAPDGAVQAVGKVTLSGPGVTATCQRLTLPLSGEQMLLDGQAEARIHEGPQPGDKEAAVENRPAWELKGEQLTLRPAGMVRWQNSAGFNTHVPQGEGQAVRPAVLP